jgi:ribulose-5-phosphate 4-epimerase/fuculose-1-phosphate aldolase
MTAATGPDDLARRLCDTGRSLHARGYVHASAGNLSAPHPGGGWFITPTDASLGTLDPARLSRVGADGTHLAGDRPSKTLALHRRLYEADPEAGCVLHTHSTHLVALTLHAPGEAAPVAFADLLPPITPYFVMKVGHVPLIPYHRPGDPVAAELVARCVREAAARGAPIRAVMLERLGPVVWGRTPEDASAVLEELEETARLWWMHGRRVAPLGEAAIDELRRQFGARW